MARSVHSFCFTHLQFNFKNVLSTKTILRGAQSKHCVLTYFICRFIWAKDTIEKKIKI